MLKKIISVIVAVVLLAAITVVPARADVDISAKCAIVINACTGEVLFEKNADEQMLIASTTKIMTALLAIENGCLTDMVTVPKVCESIEGTSIHLKAEEKITLRELLYGLLLESGNDAAVAIAYHISGGVEQFADLMCSRAIELGCENTHFANPNGLDAEGHYSSARDMAAIMARAMKNEIFEEIVSTKTISFEDRTFTNHNKLLWSYDGMIGGKTGYTMKAGRTLVTCAEKNGVRLVCVTLSDPDDWNDHAALYDSAFSMYNDSVLYSAGDTVTELNVISGEKESICVTTEEDIVVRVKDTDEVTCKVFVPQFVYAKVFKGGTAGFLKVYINGEEKITARLVYTENIERIEARDTVNSTSFINAIENVMLTMMK